jgi:hypothetical protein
MVGRHGGLDGRRAGSTGRTAFVVTGTTPYHAGYDDFGQARVTLTATCPG